MHPQSTPHNPPPRLTAIDALRGLAAISVVGAHMLTTGDTAHHPLVAPLVRNFDFGQFGVCLFFVISGYVISLSLDHTPFAKFWWRRFLRLYPTYWISIALVVALATLGWASPADPQFAVRPVWSVIANLTMVQSLLGVDHLMGVYWTLFIELLFYGMVSLVMRLQLAHHSVGIAVAWIGTAAVNDAIAARMGIASPISLTYFALMFIGVVLYRAHQRQVARHTALALGLLCTALLLVTPVPYYVVLARVMVLPCFALLVWAGYSPRILVRLGQMSYPLYLLHEVIIAIIATGSLWLDRALWLGVSVLSAWLIYSWVERPMMRLGRRTRQRFTV